MRERWIEAIKKQGKYTLHNCSMCHYECGWIYIDNRLHYDAGCDCTTYKDVRLVDESELDFYLNPAKRHVVNIEKFIEESEAKS